MWQSSLVKQRSPACKFLIDLFKKDLSIFQKIYFKEYNIPVVKIIGTLCRLFLVGSSINRKPIDSDSPGWTGTAATGSCSRALGQFLDKEESWKSCSLKFY